MPFGAAIMMTTTTFVTRRRASSFASLHHRNSTLFHFGIRGYYFHNIGYGFFSIGSGAATAERAKKVDFIICMHGFFGFPEAGLILGACCFATGRARAWHAGFPFVFTSSMACRSAGAFDRQL